MSGCKYITISYNILSDKRLNSTDKLVYGIIESACRMYDSCCTMSNDKYHHKNNSKLNF